MGIAGDYSVCVELRGPKFVLWDRAKSPKFAGHHAGRLQSNTRCVTKRKQARGQDTKQSKGRSYCSISRNTFHGEVWSELWRGGHQGRLNGWVRCRWMQKGSTGSRLRCLLAHYQRKRDINLATRQSPGKALAGPPPGPPACLVLLHYSRLIFFEFNSGDQQHHHRPRG